MTVSTKPPLPGDSPSFLDRVIRVDHAGEYGAKRIYAGQLAVLRNHEVGPMIAHMEEQEQVHLAEFERLMVEHRARPSALLPFWHVAGFALGAATAAIGPKAAMACTVAVESVIAEHYQNQIDALPEDSTLRATITQFRDEEIEHHDTGIEHDAEDAPLYGLLSAVIKRGCKAAIWVAERV